MARSATSLLRQRIAHAMFAVAALFLSLAPALDAMAGGPAPPGSLAHALRAFDIVDDALDHLPGQSPSAQQQQLQAPHAFPDTVMPTRSVSASIAAWPLDRPTRPSTTYLEHGTPPPRV